MAPASPQSGGEEGGVGGVDDETATAHDSSPFAAELSMPLRPTYYQVCMCVCVWERERESVCVCVCVFVGRAVDAVETHILPGVNVCVCVRERRCVCVCVRRWGSRCP